ncbi:hypothetical protein C1646_689406 [Rhizophagus diaphanus]|nr:hypothetical protein C1646_689406 [Rhizophagus diaphanus] [Rhizophagus sp. MUCL 43196]
MKSWAKDFILIGSYSNNQCQYPKLHHFLYHMIPAIKDYESPNGWNAETFESLHKTYIKDPYCMSNKHNVNSQILGTVMRKCKKYTGQYFSINHIIFINPIMLTYIKITIIYHSDSLKL